MGDTSSWDILEEIKCYDVHKTAQLRHVTVCVCLCVCLGRSKNRIFVFSLKHLEASIQAATANSFSTKAGFTYAKYASKLRMKE